MSTSAGEKPHPAACSETGFQISRSLVELAADVYLDSLFSRLPVLDYKQLARARHRREPLHDRLGLLRYAVVAAAMPWIDEHCLPGHTLGACSRDEAFGCCLDECERLLDGDADRSTLVEVQLLLMMSFAASGAVMRATGARQRQWLRRAAIKIKSMQAHPEEIGKHGRLWRRIWSSCALMERLHFLRHLPSQPSGMLSLGSRLPFALPMFAAGRLLLDDFEHIPPVCKPRMPVSEMERRTNEYWDLVRQASFFIQRTQVCSRIDRLLSPCRPRVEEGGQPCNLPSVSDDQYFWGVHDIAEEFQQRQTDLGAVPISGLIENSRNASVAAEAAVLYLTVCQASIVLHRARLNVQRPPGGALSHHRDEPVDDLRNFMVVHFIRRIIETASMILSRPPGSGSRHVDPYILRSIVVAADALAAPELRVAPPSDILSLRRNCRNLLRMCVRNIEDCWEMTERGEGTGGNSHPMHGAEQTISSSDCGPASDLESSLSPECDLVPTPESDVILTPAHWHMLEPPKETYDTNKPAQRWLIDAFDEMWNVGSFVYRTAA